MHQEHPSTSIECFVFHQHAVIVIFLKSQLFCGVLRTGIKPLTYGRVICISKRAKVTRDDRIQSSGALILGGNGNGVAGYGYGRGKTAQLALIDGISKTTTTNTTYSSQESIRTSAT